MEKNDVLFNVLWIDDEWEKHEDFMDFSKKKYKIQFIPTKVRKEGLRMYNEDPQKWDAVILDVKCYNESENEDASKKGFRKTQDAFSKDFDLPTFIYTGQPDYVGNEDFEADFGEYYDKTTNDDQDRLLMDIIRAIKDKPNRVIKNKYKDIFEWYPNHTNLLKILNYVEENKNNNPEVFNMIRQELEGIMQKLDDYGLFPHFYLSFKGTNTSECSRFLGDKEIESVVPIYIQRAFHSCTDITNPLSHKNEYDINEAPYLIRSTVFELLNILIWVHSLPSNEEEKKKITDKIKRYAIDKLKQEWLTVETDKEHNYYCKDIYLLRKNYFDNIKDTLQSKRVRILDFEDNTDVRTKDKYPYFVSKHEIRDEGQ